MGNQIIDFDRKGNVIRFFIGENGKQWGDDWNDCPYDCNAGRVYNEFVEDDYDISLPFDWEVLEPKDGVLNCRYTKEDMMRRRVPCMIFIPPRVMEKEWFFESFDRYIGNNDVIKVYFGDTIEHVSEMLEGET